MKLGIPITHTLFRQRWYGTYILNIRLQYLLSLSWVPIHFTVDTKIVSIIIITCLKCLTTLVI